MPSASRRVAYQASEQGREGVILEDSQGQEITQREAVERLGGAQAPYVELVSDASRIEVEALKVRRPDLEPEQVMARHFAAQARELAPLGRAVVAVHGEPDGSYHAHILLPGSEADYPRLEGRRGAAQQAWDRAWKAEKPFHPLRDRASREAAERLESEIRGLRKEANRLAKEARPTDADAEIRWKKREAVAAAREKIEAQLHTKTSEALALRYRSRGQEGSLEHLVEVDREAHRHTAEARRIAQERDGIGRERNAREDRDLFRHLTAAERIPHRDAAFRRDLAAIAARQKLDLERAPEWNREGLQARHQVECEVLLLRHQAARLRDLEGEQAKVLDRPKSGLRALLEGRQDPPRDLLAERQALEVRALFLEAEGRGRSVPAVVAARLSARHAQEVEDLEARATMAQLTPEARTEWREATFQRRCEALREGARAELEALQKEAPSAARAARTEAVGHRRDCLLEALDLERKAANLRDLERTGIAQSTQAMPERHRLEEAALRLRARTSGLEGADPADLAKLRARHRAERLGLAQRAGVRAVSAASKATQKAVALLPRAALHSANKALKAQITEDNTSASRDAEQVLRMAEGAAVGVAQVAISTALTAAQEAAKAAIHQARHLAEGLADVAKGISVGVASGNPFAGARVTGEALARVGGEVLKDAAQDAAQGVARVPQDAARAIKSALTLDVLGAAAHAGATAVAVARKGADMIRGKHSMPLDKVVDLAAKIPIIGIAAKVTKLAAEVAMGASTLAKGIDLER